MPFIGRDWRSPGDKWVKLNKGWEEMKLLDNSGQVKYQKESGSGDEDKCIELPSSDGGSGAQECIRTDSHDHNEGVDKLPSMPIKPYIFNGKQQYSSPRGFTSLKDAFRKLDFIEGINDMKRFNYISKVLSLLVKERLHTLSGTGQKCVFGLAESVIEHGLANNRNFRLLHSLVRDLDRAIAEDCAYGRHVGSDALWSGHARDVARWRAALEHRYDYANHRSCGKRCKKAKNLISNHAQHTQPELTAKASDADFEAKSRDTVGNRAVLADLPRECLFKIVSCLSDHQDLINLSNCSTFKKSSPLQPCPSISIKLPAPPNNAQDKTTSSPNHDIYHGRGLMERIHILSRVFNGKPHNVVTSVDDVQNKNVMENLSHLANLAECAGDAFLWKKLCRFHFTEQQIFKRVALCHKTVDNEPLANSNVDWQNMFFKLKRYYGVKEIYANMLHFCLGCKCIFWKEIGHPCAHDQSGNNPHSTIRIYPHEFIEIILF